MQSVEHCTALNKHEQQLATLYYTGVMCDCMQLCGGWKPSAVDWICTEDDIAKGFVTAIGTVYGLADSVAMQC